MGVEYRQQSDVMTLKIKEHVSPIIVMLGRGARGRGGKIIMRSARMGGGVVKLNVRLPLHRSDVLHVDVLSVHRLQTLREYHCTHLLTKYARAPGSSCDPFTPPVIP